MKAMVCSLDGDTDILLRNTLALFLFIICQDYVLQMSIDLMKENGFILKKERSRRYSTETIMNADDADNFVLLINRPAQAELLQDDLE